MTGATFSYGDHMRKIINAPMSRRDWLFGSAAVLAWGLLPVRVFARTRQSFRIGYIAPATGPLAIFSEPDDFVIGQFLQATGAGIKVGDTVWPVEVIRRDCQSRADVAEQAAKELVALDVDLVMSSSTPACSNPVADVCEQAGVPCLTTISPWESWYFGRGATSGQTFKWTYHFFFGLEDIINSYLSLWQPLNSTRPIGVLWPDDTDGYAFSDPSSGFPPALAKAGYDMVDPGRFALDGSADFAAIVRLFQQRKVEIVTGALPPPVFVEFWRECLKQGYKPRALTIAKAVEFPEVLMPFRHDASGITSLVWWSPQHPWSSGMTGESSKQLAQNYMRSSGRNWTMPLGLKHAHFELVLDILKRSFGPGQRESIRQAMASTDYQSVVGRINFSTGPVPNVSKTALVCGQWDYQFRYLELLIVDNKGASDVSLQAHIRPMS
jgi:branched-chain amino acid transport system substrate-binding protein